MRNVKDPRLFAAIRQFLAEYLPKIRSRSPHTVQAYRDSINLFMKFLKGCKNLELSKVTSVDFNRENIVEFLGWLKTERKCSDATCNQRLVCIRVFCKYLSGDDVIEFDGYAKIEEIAPTKTAERMLRELLSIEQISQLLKLPDKEKPLGLRDYCFIALLYETGCRSSEILTMKLGDFALHKDGSSEVRIIGKGRKFRVTPVTAEVTAIFHQYTRVFHSESNQQKPLFYAAHKPVATQMSPDNAARILKKYESSAYERGLVLPHLHPHLFRHSRAMHLYQAGMPLSIVGEWLGHSNLETTMIYAYADTEMKRNAWEKVRTANNSVFTDEVFKYKDDENVLKKLYGLA